MLSGLSNLKHHFILASGSPRRKFLLEEIGLDFEVSPVEADESFPTHLQREEIALYLCKMKSSAYTGRLDKNTVLITADTIVWVGNKVLNKPSDKDEAFEMLNLLSGKKHEVYTGVCLRSAVKENAFFACSSVYFKTLTKDEILYYIDTLKPYDKAGAYGAQECLPTGMNPCSTEEIEFLKSICKLDLIEKSIKKSKNGTDFTMINKIEGSYFNVMGLPLKELYEELILF